MVLVYVSLIRLNVTFYLSRFYLIALKGLMQFWVLCVFRVFGKIRVFLTCVVGGPFPGYIDSTFVASPFG